MDYIDNFEKNRLFDGLAEDEIKRVTAAFQKESFSSGEYVFRENDRGNTLYIVEEGSVSLKKLIVNDYEKTLFVASEGLVFGEFSFIDGKERSASAVAENDVALLGLPRDAFDEFIRDNPATGLKLYNNLLGTIVDRLRQTNNAYRDAIRWGIEVTGTQKLNFQHFITESVNLRLELMNNRIIEGKILQLEQSDAGYELIIANKSGDLRMIPYHAINAVSIAKEDL
ncbi:MAG: cyclic nucleotide-binding domain-containing protein [Pseudomonadota bacterium]